jgi:zinc transporter ZupT
MRNTDKLNLAGFVIASAGSMLGMAGALLQTNAYYPFKPAPLIKYLLGITLGPILGKNVADEIHTAAKLAEKRPEDRAKSLHGLYFLFCGFLLQLVGAAVLLAAALLSP